MGHTRQPDNVRAMESIHLSPFCLRILTAGLEAPKTRRLQRE